MDDNDNGAWHRQVAVDQFNRAWDLIEKADRTADDEAEMLLAAATSRWHWERVGNAENVAAGDWQVAHVASHLGYGDLALAFAHRNLAIATAEGWIGWRLASAHEGMARACATVGDSEGRDRHLAAAERALEDEDDADNARVVIDQLATIRR